MAGEHTGLKNALEMFRARRGRGPSNWRAVHRWSDCSRPPSRTRTRARPQRSSSRPRPIHAHRVRRYDRRRRRARPPPRHQLRPLEKQQTPAYNIVEEPRRLRRLHTGQTFELPEWSAARRCARPLSALGPAPPQGVQGARGARACREQKKAGVESINSRLALVMKSGKALLGYKSTLKSLRQGKCARRPAPAIARGAAAELRRHRAQPSSS